MNAWPGPGGVVALVAALGAALLAGAARRVAPRDAVRALAPAGPGRLRVVEARVAAGLERAELAVTPRDALTIWFGVVVAAVVLTGGLGFTAALAGASVVGVGPPLALALGRGRAQRRLLLDLPAGLEHVASELRSGGTVTDALIGQSQPVAGAAPSWCGRMLAGDLRRIGRRLQLGATVPEALAAWAHERSHPAVRVCAGALAVAADAGGAAAGALDALAASLRDRGAVAAEARALSAQARLSAVVVGAAPFVFTALGALGDPRSVSFLVATSAGRVCLGVALALEVLAALWMRRLLREPAW